VAIREWLANTWEGSIIKIALGAALGALGSWLATADVHPLIVALGAAVIPVIINALNTADPRYGRGHQPPMTELATAYEFEIEGEDAR
jgi:hypothetical protein